jgi:hypothetical protein
VTWTPESQAQRREWGLDELDADPRNLSIVDPMDAVLRRRREREAVARNGSGPATHTEAVLLDADGLPMPDDDVELLMPDGSAGSVDIATVDTSPPAPMLVERLDPDGHTILYGTGGVGKGALACWWIAQLVREGHGVLIVDYEAHPAEWSRRIAALAPDAHQSGRVRHIAPRTPLRACAEMLATEAQSFALDVVVVDSAVMGCGADPLKPEAAADYAAAVIRVGRPVLSLAHVTKADDSRYPFGSVFWHNLARTTWGLQSDQSGAVVLSHRKHNNYASLGRFTVAATWQDGRLLDVMEKGYGQALKERVTEILGIGPMTVSDIVDALNGDEWEGTPVKRETVRRVLTRHVLNPFRLSGDRWEVPA